MNRNRLHQLVKYLNPVDCVQTVLEHRRLTLSAVATLTLLFVAFIPGLAFKTSIHDLINVFDPLKFQKITQMEAAAKTITGVQRVIGLPGLVRASDYIGQLAEPNRLEVLCQSSILKRRFTVSSKQPASK